MPARRGTTSAVWRRVKGAGIISQAFRPKRTSTGICGNMPTTQGQPSRRVPTTCTLRPHSRSRQSSSAIRNERSRYAWDAHWHTKLPEFKPFVHDVMKLMDVPECYRAQLYEDLLDCVDRTPNEIMYHCGNPDCYEWI